MNNKDLERAAILLGAKTDARTNVINHIEEMIDRWATEAEDTFTSAWGQIYCKEQISIYTEIKQLLYIKYGR